MMEVKIHREGTDLVIGDNCEGGTYALGYNTLRLPGRAWQRDYATSPTAHGDVLYRKKLVHTMVEFTAIVKGSTYADMVNALETLYDALGQFNYVTRVTIKSAQYTFSSDPADVTPQEQTLAMVSSNAQLVAVTIPVYPVYGRT
jgi:hypothetical protein